MTKVRVACVTLCAFGLGFATATSASAESFSYGAYEGGGWGYWQEDPGPDPMGGIDDAPGDSIAACDMRADGWGIEVRLDIGRDGDIDRKVSTRGQHSPYCSDWKSGDISPEGTPVRVWVVKVKGTTDYHPVYKDGNA